MALHLAREHGVEVTGVTLSNDQYETSVRRAREAGLSDRVKFQLRDYRLEPGPFDRIVSVGMFEHVGEKNLGEFFDHINRLLKPDGVALLHTIARMPHPAPVNPWTLKYIFPGGYLPAMSQLSPLLENRRLWLTDFETLRLHYARTLFEWDRRFQENRAKVAEMHDERFCRMWEFYLQSAERAFHHQGLAVFQLQIAKDIGAVPLTRDYMYPGAVASPAAEAAAPPEEPAAKPRRTRARPAPVKAAEPQQTEAPARRATTRRKRQSHEEPAE
jgi:cyclopropane-fatty-acyl-phospholipid synthase